jgi:hypothetical protein
MKLYQFITLFIIFIVALAGVVVGDGDELQERTTLQERQNGTERAAGTWHTAEDGLRYLKLRDDFPANHPALNMTLILELKALGQEIPQLPGIDAAEECLWAGYPLPAANPTCETSGGSPTVGDADELANQLILDGKALCCSPPFLNKHCKTCRTKGTAASDVCNFKGDGGICVCCTKIGEDVQRIRNDCANNGRAGGYIK